MNHITTAAELEALPVGSVVLWGDDRKPFWNRNGSWVGVDNARIEGAALDLLGKPATILFRPDAPQPATTDPLALAAAGATRYPHTTPEAQAEEDATDAGGAEPSPLCECGEPKDGHSRPSGEAVDRKALARVIAGAVYGDPANLSRATEAADAVLAILAARGDAAPGEVEWGVLVDIDTIVPARSREYAAKIARLHEHQGRNPQIIQRTVFAWREVR